MFGAGREPAAETAGVEGRWTVRPSDGGIGGRTGQLDFGVAGDGNVGCLFSAPLDGLPAGEYDLVLHVRDQLDGKTLEGVEPITLTEAQ